MPAQLTPITRLSRSIIRTIELGMVLGRFMSFKIMLSFPYTISNEQLNVIQRMLECGMPWGPATRKFAEKKMLQFVLRKLSH